MKSFAILLIAGIACVSGSIPPAPFHNDLMQKDKCVRRCTEDCLGVYMCVGDLQIRVDCDVQTGKPYCHPSSTTCTYESGFCWADAGNVCFNGEGLHPDVRDCHRYYNCLSNGAHPANYRCEGDAVFDPDHRQCAPGISCYNFTENDMCEKQEGKLIPHPLNPNYFVMCQTPRSKLFKCKLGYVFKPDLFSCEYVCTSAGKFPDDYDESRYYECIKSNDHLLTYHQHCDNGTNFNPDLQLCQ